MNYYRDITLLPDTEIGHHFLWEKVFGQVHLALVEAKNEDERSPFGVTFPAFKADKHRIGNKLRIFSDSEECLTSLNLDDYLNRLSDYVHVTSIRTVPEKVSDYIRFRRLQTKTSPERLARRDAKQGNLSIHEAIKKHKDFIPQYTDAPYIWVNSLSSKQRYPFFIVAEKVTYPNEQQFSLYGLSNKDGGGLPHF